MTTDEIRTQLHENNAEHQLLIKRWHDLYDAGQYAESDACAELIAANENEHEFLFRALHPSHR